MLVPEGDIFLSSGAFQATSVGAIVDQCDAIGFHNVELSSGLPWSEHIEHEIIAAATRCRFMVHNYFPAPREPFVLNLAARDPGVLQRSRELCERAIRLCAAIGSPVYSVHSGFAFEVDPSRLGRRLADAERYPMRDALGIFIESLQSLCEYGAARGVTIAIENNVVASMNLIEGENLLLLGATAEELLEILERVESPQLRILVDVGHLKVTARTLGFDPSAFIEQLADRIAVFHLSENDGLTDTNQLFGSGVWFAELVRKYPRPRRVIESYGLGTEEMKQALATTRSL